MFRSLPGGGSSGGSRSPSFLFTWAVAATTAAFTTFLLLVVHMLSPSTPPCVTQNIPLAGSGDPNRVYAGQVSRVQMAWGDRQQQRVQAAEGEGGEEGSACRNWILAPVTERGIPNTRKWSPWMPPLSPCRVQGLPIEAVEPDLNFRRGFTLGYVDYGEDKTQLLPYLRAALDHRMHTSARRVLIDFGANAFRTSVTWFLSTYPLEFTEVHAFEIQPDLFVVPQPNDQVLGPISSGSRLRPRGQGPGPIPGWMLQRIHSYNTLVGMEDSPHKNVINATRWMLEELRLTPQDTVVVKMDIEGVEWPVLNAWLDIPGMEQIVDELFVEIHYHHESMYDFKWNATRFSATRDEAAQMFNWLRTKGFYVHAWP
ncbi:hypothetical protein CLOM_g16717 [Closterium sp. NIES-68]|nr:hypothetical protein CLOM_g16717 [Closterium sp. NIES-68]GJP63807.1 hypothetical protein CLOP_g20850 [Closterium sp. NIES-67]